MLATGRPLGQVNHLGQIGQLWRIKRLSAAVLVAGLALTLGVAEVTRRFGVTEHLRIEQSLLNQVNKAVRSKLDVDIALLSSVGGLFNASITVDRGEFRSFYGSIASQAAHRGDLTGIQGIGYARRLLPQELPGFVAEMRREGLPSFSVHPGGRRPLHAVVEFVEPFNLYSRRLYGLDIQAAGTAREALERSAQTGQATLTGPLELLKEPAADRASGPQPGAVLVLPIFPDGNGSPASSAPGGNDPMGWAFSPLRLDDLITSALASITDPDLPGAVIQVSDTTPGSSNGLLFRSTLGEGPVGTFPRESQQQSVQLAGRTWVIQLALRPSHLSRYGITPSFWLVLVSGLGTTLVAALGAHLLARRQLTTRQALALSEAAARERALASTVFDASDQGIVVTDHQGRILMANNAFTQLTGYRLSEIQAQHASQLQSGEHSQAFYQDIAETLLERGYWQGDLWNRIRSGELRRLHLAISTVRDDDLAPRNYVGFVEDITERHRAEEIVRYQALHDTLTGLANRALLMQQLERDLAVAKRHGRSIGLLYLDLDGFKRVNDLHGHATGDRVLQIVGERLQKVLRESDLLCRQGGDEFVVLVPDAGTPDELMALASKLVATTNEPLEGLDPRIRLSACVGIARYPDHGLDMDALIGAADRAMYEAKRRKGIHVQLAEMRQQAPR